MANAYDDLCVFMLVLNHQSSLPTSCDYTRWLFHFRIIDFLDIVSCNMSCVMPGSCGMKEFAENGFNVSTKAIEKFSSVDYRLENSPIYASEDAPAAHSYFDQLFCKSLEQINESRNDRR